MICHYRFQKELGKWYVMRRKNSKRTLKLWKTLIWMLLKKQIRSLNLISQSQRGIVKRGNIRSLLKLSVNLLLSLLQRPFKKSQKMIFKLLSMWWNENCNFWSTRVFETKCRSKKLTYVQRLLNSKQLKILELEDI